MYYILLMGSGFLLVMAVGQLFVPRRTDANNILCLFLFGCCFWLTHGIGFKLGMLDVYPHLNKIHVPFLAATGPLWYIYIRALLTGGGWTRLDRLHLLPVLFCTVLLLPFLFQSEAFKRNYVEIDISGFVTLSVYIATRVAELATMLYLAMAVRMLRSEQAGSGATSPVRSNSIMLVLTLLGVVAAIARLFGSIAGNHSLSVLLPIIIVFPIFIGLYCLSQRHPWLMAVSVRAARPKYVTDEGASCLEKYRECIRSNRWHLDPDLKIMQLARRLGVPPHDLSELINRESGANFNHFINALRIEHAKQQLIEHADTPVLDIALASGFNSTSAFYAQFTRFVSMPPAAYRRCAKTYVENSGEIVS